MNLGDLTSRELLECLEASDGDAIMRPNEVTMTKQMLRDHILIVLLSDYIERFEESNY